MLVANHQHKYNTLREKYSRFVYEKYSCTFHQNCLRIEYGFNVPGVCEFRPALEFVFPERLFPAGSDFFQQIERYVFYLGMIEMISYWKAACPPEVIVVPFSLSEDETEWWKKTYHAGLGEFFYMNGIRCDRDGFMHIRSEATTSAAHPEPAEVYKERTVIPVGGGKDSCVTLELLKNRREVIPLMINPTPAALEVARIAGFPDDQTIRIRRQIDPELLRLNASGFLNGHTPFSAVIAFAGLLAAKVAGARFIALSNESSANEPTDKVTGVNHQYSKTFEFERDFRNFVSGYITPSIHYFSFLRPLSELQIASVFARFTQYHATFRSCNKGMKSNEWCGKCSKCLFTWIILSPFLPMEALKAIWRKDLFSDEDLVPLLDELTGVAPVKPFECVGTYEDVRIALSAVIRGLDPGKPLPVLLQHFSESSRLPEAKHALTENVNGYFDNNHFLLPEFEELLIRGLHAR